MQVCSVYVYHGFTHTSMLRLYCPCWNPLPEHSDNRSSGLVWLMKEFKDFRVANMVVSSSKSMLTCFAPEESIVQNNLETDETLAENAIIKRISAIYCE